MFELFKEMLNKNIKDDNLKINEFDQNKVKDINIKENRLLGKKKWKDIILNNSNGNEEIINKIYNCKKKNIIELLEMNFCDYLEIFKKNNLNQFLQKEKSCQIAKYKQKKYRQIIKKKE